MNEPSSSQNREKADSEPQNSGGGAQGQRMILGHLRFRDTRPGLEPGAIDLTLPGEHIRQGGGELLLGRAYLAPVHPPPPPPHAGWEAEGAES